MSASDEGSDIVTELDSVTGNLQRKKKKERSGPRKRRRSKKKPEEKKESKRISQTAYGRRRSSEVSTSSDISSLSTQDGGMHSHGGLGYPDAQSRMTPPIPEEPSYAGQNWRENSNSTCLTHFHVEVVSTRQHRVYLLHRQASAFELDYPV